MNVENHDTVASPYWPLVWLAHWPYDLSNRFAKSYKPCEQLASSYWPYADLPNSYIHWHTGLGHTAKLDPTVYSDGELLPKVPSKFICHVCILSKSTNKTPFALSDVRSSRPFELIHSDLSGKQPTPSYGNSLYYITFIDDFTRMSWMYYLKAKSDAYQVLVDFISFIQRQFNTIQTTRNTVYKDTTLFPRIQWRR